MKQEARQCPFNTDQGTGSCIWAIEGKGTLLCKRDGIGAVFPDRNRTIKNKNIIEVKITSQSWISQKAL